jgi:multiple sugar transport system permease protein
LLIAFSDWNLASVTGRKFNGLANVRQMWADPFYWNALSNMVWYCVAILPEYAVAFGLALLLNAEIRARKFFRVAFLLPLMLSPVAVSWMIGKSMLELRFGPIARLARWLGWDNPSFFGSPEVAKFAIMLLDAWTFIPFMMIMILAGLQAIPKELNEAARVDGASPWKSFWEITFPLMLPVSVTVVLIRLIFKLKLADIIITITSGGPGGATDSVTSFIFREYRDRSNVGYGTLLAMVYLVIIIIVMTILMKLAQRFARPRT